MSIDDLKSDYGGTESQTPFPIENIESEDRDNGQEINELLRAADNLALAAALVVTEYDGIHRLRAKLALYYDLRAGIHGSKHNKAIGSKLGENRG